MDIRCVDICCGLNWGDEAKGKIIAQLSKSGRYQFVCRWAGGHNAGHTVYVNGNKYKTHLIPCFIFYQIPSIIGPDCVVHETSFLQEMETLQSQGFNTSLVKISPNAHVVTDAQIQEDAAQYNARTSTGSGISQCYRDKYARIGKRVCEIESLREFIWNGVLYGNVLCEGAQGFWLDINQGHYPYVTSSTTLPYGACSLGFPPQCIRTVYGVTKIYDTRAGTDPLFPDTLFDNPDLNRIIEIGKEYGTTTGKKRKVNWLNVDKLIDAIRISGAMQIIVSKTDVLEQVGQFKMYYLSELRSYSSLDKMKSHLEVILTSSCERVEKVFFSGNKETVDGLLDSDLIIPH